MRAVRYVSGAGKEFLLNQDNDIQISKCNPWSSKWKYTSVANQCGVRIKRFEKDVLQLSITFKFRGSQIIAATNLNSFFASCEKDVLEMTPGRLYIDDEYLEGYVIARETEPTQKWFGYVQTITFMAPYPFWIREVTQQFFGGTTTASDGLNYQYNYQYNYKPESRGTASWYIDHYAGSDFKMIIYGPATNPSISIGGHTYNVNLTLSSGDYLTIDSRENTIVLTTSAGVTSNAYRYRNKTYSVFEPIQGGTNAVIWSGTFGFDVTVFLERSEPEWKVADTAFKEGLYTVYVQMDSDGVVTMSSASDGFEAPTLTLSPESGTITQENTDDYEGPNFYINGDDIEARGEDA